MDKRPRENVDQSQANYRNKDIIGLENHYTELYERNAQASLKIAAQAVEQVDLLRKQLENLCLLQLPIQNKWYEKMEQELRTSRQELQQEKRLREQLKSQLAQIERELDASLATPRVFGGDERQNCQYLPERNWQSRRDLLRNEEEDSTATEEEDKREYDDSSDSYSDAYEDNGQGCETSNGAMGGSHNVNTQKKETPMSIKLPRLVFKHDYARM